MGHGVWTLSIFNNICCSAPVTIFPSPYWLFKFQADNAPGFYACDGGATSKSCYKPKGGTKLVLGEVSREVQVYRPSSPFGLRCTNRQGVSLNVVLDVTKRYKEICGVLLNRFHSNSHFLEVWGMPQVFNVPHRRMLTHFETFWQRVLYRGSAGQK